jgi:hypothetical protein
MLDGLLEKGYRVMVNAGDDAHFGHPLDRSGAWVEVHCDSLDPEALLRSLKSGLLLDAGTDASGVKPGREFAARRNHRMLFNGAWWRRRSVVEHAVGEQR